MNPISGKCGAHLGEKGCFRVSYGIKVSTELETPRTEDKATDSCISVSNCGLFVSQLMTFRVP